MSKPTIDRLLELQQFLLAFQGIERIVYLPDKTKRKENDVEHSYALAMSAWFLAQYFPELDRDKVIRYALAHDLIEVHAGDTYIFAQDDSINTKKEREHAAMKQITIDWPDFPDLLTAITAYEKRQDAEAKFVYALDKIMPIMLNYLGKGHGWHKHQVTIEMLHTHKKDKVSQSPEINQYYNDLYALLERVPHFFHQEQQQ